MQSFRRDASLLTKTMEPWQLRTSPPTWLLGAKSRIFINKLLFINEQFIHHLYVLLVGRGDKCIKEPTRGLRPPNDLHNIIIAFLLLSCLCLEADDHLLYRGSEEGEIEVRCCFQIV